MSKKASDIIRLLKDALQLEFPSFVITDGSTAGDPWLSIAEDVTPVSTEEVAFIKVIQRDYSGFPTPSLASNTDGRSHILQICFELDAAGNNTVWSALNNAKLMARVKDANVDIAFYAIAVGAVPVEADLVDGNFKGEIKSSAKYVNIGQ